MTTSAHNPFTGNASYWWYRAKALILENYFGSKIFPEALVLDIGSADGPAVKFIEKRLRKDSQKISMDIEPEGLRPEDILGSVENIPVEDDFFDIVSAFDVIEHVKNEALGFNEIYRVLKPGGAILVSVPAYQWAWSKHDEALHHFRRYTTGRLAVAAREAGFHDVEVSYAFFGTFPIFALQRIIAKFKGAYSGETPEVSAFQDKILMGLIKIDLFALKLGLKLPWGSSVLLKARKPE